MLKLQPVRGVCDVVEKEYDKITYLYERARDIFTKCGYQFIDLPIFEFTEIFTRSLGNASDIVSKEMYSFKDKSGNGITLRPEFTASIVRYVVYNSLLHNLPLFLATFGSVFRYERPQKCRQRQFRQINCEMIGVDSYNYDIDLISSALEFLDMPGIKNNVTLHINSLGDTEGRFRYVGVLREYLAKYIGDLSEDSRERLQKNPLRILDSKDPGDLAVLADAPAILDYISKDSYSFFEKVLTGLDALKIKYIVNNQLVRGLDYYTDTVFEFITENLGSQGAVLSGGRYNGLFTLMSSHNVPALGFAAGVERLAAMLDYKKESVRPIIVLLLSNRADVIAHDILIKLRKIGYAVILLTDYNIAKGLKKANKANASQVLIFGEDEMSGGYCVVKDMDSGVQHDAKIHDVVNVLDQMRQKV